jgi:structural maintenance of chromosomes protein 6
MDDDLCQYNEQIAQYDRDIAAEEQRAEKHTSGKREQTRRKLEEAKERLNAAENEKSQLAAEYRELEEANIAVKNIGMEEDRKIKELKSQVVRFQEIIEQCKRKENDKFIPYGNNIKTALDRIGRMKWSGEVPLGPLGLYVNAKEPAKWGNVLRYYLGQYLTAFAITDARDRPILKKLLAELGKYVLYTPIALLPTYKLTSPNTLIVIYEKDMFDYSRGELPPETLTVHRALDVLCLFLCRRFHSDDCR